MAKPEHSAKFLADLKSILAAKPESLDEWEASFVAGLRERHAKWGDAIFVSDKQKGIVAKIAAELRGEKVPRPKPKKAAPASVADELNGDLGINELDPDDIPDLS